MSFTTRPTLRVRVSRGLTGPTGATGATGPTGSTGATGATGPGYYATSVTSNSIASSGSKTFTTQSGLAYTIGTRVRAADATNAAVNYMEGVVTSYSGTTLIFTADYSAGSGTLTNWTLQVAGERGATGAQGPQGDPGTMGGTIGTTDNVVPRADGTGGTTFQAGTFTNADNGNVYPNASDTGALGTSTNMWADLFLASGAVINFNNGDVTATHASNSLSFSGASSGYSFDALVTPSANDAAPLGSAAVSWSDLFLASGGVINWNNGTYTATQSGSALTLSGTLSLGTSNALTAGSIELGHASDTTISRSASGVIAVEGVDLYPSIPQNSQSTAYTCVLGDANKHILHPAADNNARTFTIPANSSVAYPIGTTLTFINEINTVTISITTDTLTLSSAGTTGSRTLAANGMATAIKITSTKWMISGSGLT